MVEKPPAKKGSTLRTAIQWVLDWLWPHVYKPTLEEKAQKEEKEAQRRGESDKILERLEKGTETEEIKDALTACEKLEEAEMDRRKSFEARLTSILGMTSVVTALLGAFIAIQAKAGEPESLHGSSIVMILMFVYGMIQLLRALLAAVNGLKRRSQFSMTVANYLPSGEELMRARQIRTLNELMNKIQDDEEINSARSDQMELAHVALRNFLVAMLAIAVLWFIASMRSNRPLTAEESIIRAIKSDPSLMERLRGPAGPQGPIGLTQERTTATELVKSCPCNDNRMQSSRQPGPASAGRK